MGKFLKTLPITVFNIWVNILPMHQVRILSPGPNSKPGHKKKEWFPIKNPLWVLFPKKIHMGGGIGRILTHILKTIMGNVFKNLPIPTLPIYFDIQKFTHICTSHNFLKFLNLPIIHCPYYYGYNAKNIENHAMEMEKQFFL